MSIVRKNLIKAAISGLIFVVSYIVVEKTLINAEYDKLQSTGCSINATGQTRCPRSFLLGIYEDLYLPIIFTAIPLYLLFGVLNLGEGPLTFLIYIIIFWLYSTVLFFLVFQAFSYIKKLFIK